MPDSPKKRVTILGATGSIGQNCCKIIEHHADRFCVEAVTAQDNVALLAETAQRMGARFAAISNPAHYDTLKNLLSGSGVEAAAGEGALVEAGGRDAEIVVAAIVGTAGLLPTFAAVERGAQVAIANKECLVAAGELLLQSAKKHGATLIPVDSEHNAIFQLFDTKQTQAIEVITLTASGGPFRQWTLEQMRAATPEQAVNHPNWQMGAKISVDSATMMNKGLELIEAHVLFGIKEAALRVAIHPESIVHSFVHYSDGSVLAQMGYPDMRTPIAYALGWPERIDAPVKKLDIAELTTLTFESPDTARFPALDLARQTMRTGGTAPAILNAANEVAVAAFLNGQIGFLDIAQRVDQTLQNLPAQPIIDLQSVLDADDESRRTVVQIL